MDVVNVGASGYRVESNFVGGTVDGAGRMPPPANHIETRRIVVAATASLLADGRASLPAQTTRLS